jgi:hypothetical protein
MTSTTITNFPVSQAVTGTVTVTQATGTNLHATIDNFPASQAVTGTVTANAGTGTFAVSASSLPLPTGAATSALQTTGNSSLSSIDGKTPALGQALAAGSTPVVLPAAQITALTPPTSVGITGSVAVTGPLTDTQLRATAVPVSGAFYQATQPISATALPLPTGAATSANQTSLITVLGSPMQQSGGSLTANAGINLNTSALALETGGNLAAINTKTPATTTKNVQATALQPTVNVTDTGRNLTTFFMVNQVVTTNADVLMSLTGYKSGAAVAATTTPAVVTAGKTYRITSLTFTYVATTTAGTAHFTLRANTAGAVALASPAVCEWTVGGPSATAGVSQTISVPIPEGIEFAAGTGIGVSMQGFGATGTAAAVGYGICKIIGYEY